MSQSASVSSLPNDPYYALDQLLNDESNEDDDSVDMETVNATSSNTENTQMSTESTQMAKARGETMTPDSERTPSVLSDGTPRQSRKRSGVSYQDHSDIQAIRWIFYH